jgi:nucleoside-diphosphate-sugar epimerase
MLNLLLTGASGFLGNCLLKELSKSYNIETLGLGNINNIDINLANEIPKLRKHHDIVLHAAGKAHSVPRSQEESLDFFKINLDGTKNLCKAFDKKIKPKAFIFISTVAVYGLEYGENISEESPLNGTIPYALSKIQAEEYLTDWCKKNDIKLTILRPALLAGKNPPGNLGAMINGINTGKYFRIGKGEARKSILMVEDIARLVPKLEDKTGIYNLCDNHHPSFAELEDLICKQLNCKPPNAIPHWIAKSIAAFGDLLGPKAPINSNKLNKITKPLTFSNSKARHELNWQPLDVLEHFRIK